MLGAPVFDIHGSAIASLGLSGPAHRITLERLAELGAEVRGAADRTTYGLGGSEQKIQTTPDHDQKEPSKQPE